MRDRERDRVRYYEVERDRERWEERGVKDKENAYIIGDIGKERERERESGGER